MSIPPTSDRSPEPDTYSDAFAEGFGVGAGHGWDLGWHAGYTERSAEYDAMLTGLVPVFKQERHDQLEQRRASLRNCTCGRCSTCGRRRQIAYNQRVYGQDDYPGRDRAREILTRLAERGAA